MVFPCQFMVNNNARSLVKLICSISWLLMLRIVRVVCLFLGLKIMCFVLDELTDSLFALSQFTILIISFCIIAFNVFRHEWEWKAFVSLAYRTKERVSLQFSILFIYKRNNNGPKIEPWGTAVVILNSFDLFSLNFTVWVLSCN